MREKNLAVADFARAGSTKNRLHPLLYHGIGQHKFQLGLGDEIDAVFTAAVDLSMSFLPAVTTHFHHRHTFDANFLQGSLNGFQLRILHASLSLRHDVLLGAVPRSSLLREETTTILLGGIVAERQY